MMATILIAWWAWLCTNHDGITKCPRCGPYSNTWEFDATRRMCDCCGELYDVIEGKEV